MKAIQTKFLGATDTKPSRVKASAEGVPSKTYSKDSLWKPYGGSGEVVNYHIEAAHCFALANNWSTNLASGGLSDPDVWVHCFLPKETPRRVAPRDETHLKIARFFLTAWPEGWSKDELFNGCWNGHPDITVDERFEFQPLEDIPQWILEIADLVA